MKVQVHHTILTIFFAVVLCTAVQSAYAQDASYPAVESTYSEGDQGRERLIYGGEGDPMLNNKIHVPVVSRDSVIARPTKTARSETPKPSGKPASQEDDSILSFNFLYYIFEKYKMQDVVD